MDSEALNYYTAISSQDMLREPLESLDRPPYEYRSPGFSLPSYGDYDISSVPYETDDIDKTTYKKEYDSLARFKLGLGTEPTENATYSIPLPQGKERSMYPKLLTQQELQRMEYPGHPRDTEPPIKLSTLNDSELHLLQVANEGFVLNTGQASRRKMIDPGLSGSQFSTASAGYYNNKSQPTDFSHPSPYEETDIAMAFMGGLRSSGSAGGYGGGSNEGLMPGGGFGFKPQNTVYLQDGGADILVPHQDYTTYGASYTDPLTGETTHTYTLNMGRYSKGAYKEPPSHEIGRQHPHMRAWTGTKDYFNRAVPQKTEVLNDGIMPTADPTGGRALAISARADATERAERDMFFTRDPKIAPLQDVGHWTGFVGEREMARHYDLNVTARKEGGGSYLMSGGRSGGVGEEDCADKVILPSGLNIYKTIKSDAGGLGSIRVSNPSIYSDVDTSAHNYAATAPSFTVSSQPAGPIHKTKYMGNDALGHGINMTAPDFMQDSSVFGQHILSSVAGPRSVGVRDPWLTETEFVGGHVVNSDTKIKTHSVPDFVPSESEKFSRGAAKSDISEKLNSVADSLYREGHPPTTWTHMSSSEKQYLPSAQDALFITTPGGNNRGNVASDTNLYLKTAHDGSSAYTETGHIALPMSEFAPRFGTSTYDAAPVDASVFSTWRSAAGPEIASTVVMDSVPGIDYDTTGSGQAEANFNTNIFQSGPWRERAEAFWAQTQGVGGGTQPRMQYTQQTKEVSGTVLLDQIYGGKQILLPDASVERLIKDREIVNAAANTVSTTNYDSDGSDY